MLKILREKKIMRRVSILAWGCILFFLYFYNVHNINTVWEIPDEAGYLFNASLLSPYDWKETFSNLTAYYGYGYSLLLIPLFYFCDTGVSLIRGCIFVNIICLLGIYLLQIYFMTKLWKEKSIHVLAPISFIVCLYPYFTSNAMKVNCEVFLSLMVWVLAALLYKALATKKKLYWFLLGAAAAFSYYIHARAIAFLFTIALLAALSILYKRMNVKEIMLLGISFLIFFMFFYWAQNFFVGILNTGTVVLSQKRAVDNLLTKDFISGRMRTLLSKENVVIYILSAIAKIFYMAASTAGVFLFGIAYGIRELRFKLKDVPLKYDDIYIIKFFLLLSFLVTYILCCMIKIDKTYANVIYGRYYESCVSPIIIMGIMYLADGSLKLKKEYLMVIGTIVGCGFFTSKLIHYVKGDSFVVDTARMSGISYAVSVTRYFPTAIFFLIGITVFTVFVYFLFAKYKQKIIISCLILLITFAVNDMAAIKAINIANKNSISDLNISNYISENMDNQSIYFVYEPYVYDTFYLRMQIFIEKYPMHIIFPEEVDFIEKGSFVITYIDSERAVELAEEGYDYIISGAHYQLFVK